MTVAQLSGPGAHGWPSVVTAGMPPQHESLDHEAFVLAAPRTQRMPPLARPRLVHASQEFGMHPVERKATLVAVLKVNDSPERSSMSQVTRRGERNHNSCSQN